MVRRSFKIECELQLKMICAPQSNMCHFDHVYINVELFGETQKSKLMHPCFPIKASDVFRFEKVLWSPQTMQEACKLLKESPVSIELRHLKTNATDSNLVAYTDSNAHDILISGSGHESSPMIFDKHIDLKSTEYHCGQPPRLKFSIRTTITSSTTPVMDALIENYTDHCVMCELWNLRRKVQACQGGISITPHGEAFSCDCELHRDDKSKDIRHCKVCHQDRTLNVCKNCHNKLQKSTKQLQAIEWPASDDEKIENGPEHFRPPFVVRKVSHSLVSRRPDAYDSNYNQVVREQTRLKSSKQKKLLRLRSVSPPKLRSESTGSTNRLTCYGCLLPANEMRISCDACNLTSRGELSNRNSDLIRPEPPLMKTYREPVDQRPIYSLLRPTGCHLCTNKRANTSDDNLCTSSRPLYLLEGYRDMAKYFTPAC